MRAASTLSLCTSLLIATAALGCEDEADPPKRTFEEALRDRVSLKIGDLIEDSELPDPTDPAVSLIDLGPASLLQPETVELLGFEVEGAGDREAVATLIAFPGTGSYIRGEVEDQNGIIENELIASAALCEGLCKGVLRSQAEVSVELDDGAISPVAHIVVALDCRDEDLEECEGGDLASDEQLCGDVTLGGTALTGDDPLDSYFDALRLFAASIGESEDELGMSRSALSQALADALDESVSNSATDIAEQLAQRFAESTDDGVHAVKADPGCAVRAPRVLHALRACDLQTAGEVMSCEGLCEQPASCEDAATSGCRGVIDAASCEGECIGACQSELDEPAACAGTCIGSCDGECPSEDGDGDCMGPCSGLCDGECLAIHLGGVCDGDCSGSCDEPTEDVELPSCDEPFHAYCSAEEGSALECTGNCLGTPMLEAGPALCQASAIATGQLAAVCDSPIVQLSFGFANALPVPDQEDFADLINAASEPMTRLFALLTRLDETQAALSALDTAHSDALERLEDSDELGDAARTCAEDTLEAAASWLDDEQQTLERLRDDALALTATLSE